MKEDIDEIEEEKSISKDRWFPAIIAPYLILGISGNLRAFLERYMSYSKATFIAIFGGIGLGFLVYRIIVVQNNSTSRLLGSKNSMIYTIKYANFVISAQAEIQVATVIDCRLRGNDRGLSIFRKVVLDSSDIEL